MKTHRVCTGDVEPKMCWLADEQVEIKRDEERKIWKDKTRQQEERMCVVRIVDSHVAAAMAPTPLATTATALSFILIGRIFGGCAALETCQQLLAIF